MVELPQGLILFVFFFLFKNKKKGYLSLKFRCQLRSFGYLYSIALAKE
jgi:hypothetical protein